MNVKIDRFCIVYFSDKTKGLSKSYFSPTDTDFLFDCIAGGYIETYLGKELKHKKDVLFHFDEIGTLTKIESVEHETAERMYLA